MCSTEWAAPLTLTVSYTEPFFSCYLSSDFHKAQNNQGNTSLKPIVPPLTDPEADVAQGEEATAAVHLILLLNSHWSSFQSISIWTLTHM